MSEATLCEPASRPRGSRTHAAGRVLEARGLRKTYRSGENALEVLKGVDLDVQEGEFVAVTGQSGSGKSTLLHLLGLLDPPDSGEIRLGQERIDALPVAARDALRNTAIGIVFQSYHLLPELTALENVLSPLLVRHGVFEWFRRRSAAVATAKDLLDRFGLAGRLHHKPRQLSGGEMQRVAIARALIAEPRVLLADEPTGNLDVETGAGILEALCELNRQDGLSIVMVTHDPSIAARADRVVRLVAGHVHGG